MASLSTDGEIITQFLNTLRFKVVRGSQAKRGMQALEEKEGYVLGVRADEQRKISRQLPRDSILYFAGTIL